MTPHQIFFDGSGLLSKFGFGDGDMISDFTDNKTDQHALLAAVVRKHLLPKLDRRVEVFEIVTGHNPIRATDETARFVGPSIGVSLSADQIWEIAKDIENA